MDRHVELVEFRAASEVAPHLDGRLPGDYEAYGETVKVCGTLPRGGSTNRHWAFQQPFVTLPAVLPSCTVYTEQRSDVPSDARKPNTAREARVR